MARAKIEWQNSQEHGGSSSMKGTILSDMKQRENDMSKNSIISGNPHLTDLGNYKESHCETLLISR